jgi:hypothetical protein
MNAHVESDRPRLFERIRGAFWEPAIARLRLRAPILVAAGLLTLLAWPLGTQRIETGVDSSWKAALHMAAHDGLVFGRDVAFTYGPLGFLTSPDLYFSSTGLIAIAVHVAVAGVLSYVVLRLLNTAVPLLLCVVVAAPILMILNPLLVGSTPLLPYSCFVVAALWAFRRVLEPCTSPWRWWDIVVPALLATAITLIKLDAGIACATVIGYAVFFCGLQTGGAVVALRRIALFVATLAVSPPLLWIVIGQPLGDLPLWLDRSREIVGGFSAAMSTEHAGSWEYAAALVVVAVLAVQVATTSQLQRGRRWLVLGYLAVVSFIAFKEGFVRHDAHSLEFFVLFALLPLALLPRRPLRQTFFAAAIPGIAVLAIANVNLASVLSPKPRAESIVDTVRLATSASERRSVIEENRRRLQQEYALPEEVVARIAGHTIDIEPDEISVAWAYYHDIEWRQEPVLQAYSAYTTSLDRAAATFFAEDRRPRFVLRAFSAPGPSIEDNRVPRFEPPEGNLALLCHYRVVYQDSTWQLLEAVRTRCGKPDALRHRTVRFGERVRIPAAGQNAIVVGRFHGVGDSLLDELQDLAYKPPEFYIRVDGGAAPFRFLQGHQDSPHVLTAPECARAQVDGPSPSDFRSIELEPRSREADDEYELELFSIPFSC